MHFLIAIRIKYDLISQLDIQCLYTFIIRTVCYRKRNGPGCLTCTSGPGNACDIFCYIIGRGVTSLTTLTGKQSPWKKIRVVETMDMINNDIVELAEDNYIGKYQNTYSNKCLLLSAIKTYMDEILVNGLIEDYSIEFDVEKIRKYVIENEKIKKEDAEAMSDEEMQKQYTDEKVYFKATVTISDVMEDIYLDITA